MNLFMMGAISMASLTAAMFFVRFWGQTRDRLFLFFAVSFLLESLSRGMLAFTLQHEGVRPSEGEPSLYLIRLLAYVLILVAIVDKNRNR